jgi:antitoxin (DNA-binding transcriptional repressor) of toxin-antitoxin stability system
VAVVSKPVVSNKTRIFPTIEFIPDFPLTPPCPSAKSHARWSPSLTKVATGSYSVGMRAVGIKVLKNKLSEYVRLAERGETILVTDRDRVVAEMGPPEASRSPLVADAMLAEAVRQGWITPPALPARGVPPRNPVMSFRKLKRELEDDRSER